MALLNCEREMLWINGSSELLELLRLDPTRKILSEGWKLLSPEEADELIQEHAYRSEKVRFEEPYWEGKKAIQLFFTVVVEYHGD